ncbi:MAG: prephenate dehydrogenase/arogenate dehydrogenase family protein [Pyrinomonadaceae bacterium]
MNDPGVQWRRVTVVGCGLIGASFALALRRAVPHVRISGWDASPLALNEALQRGAIDDVDTSFSNRSVLTSELIYLAMPVAQIIAFLRDYGPGIPANTIVTDAGSTKLEICQAAQQHLSSGSEFIGGHPIAGSHLTGPLHARAELFETAAYVLTPERESEALESLAHIVRKLGACVRQMDALEHDRAMAIVSHLPQLISSALAATVNHRDDAAALEQLVAQATAT